MSEAEKKTSVLVTETKRFFFKNPKNYKYELTQIWRVQGTSKQTNLNMFKNDVTFIELFLVPIYLTLNYIIFSIPKWRIKISWKIKFSNPISL